MYDADASCLGDGTSERFVSRDGFSLTPYLCQNYRKSVCTRRREEFFLEFILKKKMVVVEHCISKTNFFLCKSFSFINKTIVQ